MCISKLVHRKGSNDFQIRNTFPKIFSQTLQPLSGLSDMPKSLKPERDYVSC